MAQTQNVLQFIIVGEKDYPLYEADLSIKHADAVREERPQYLYHFVLHAALDAVEDQEWVNNGTYLGVVDRFNNLQVSAFTTGCHTRFLLLHDGRTDDSIRNFFKGVHELYLRIALNPFFIPTIKITSQEFHTKVKQLARVYFKQ